MKKKGKADIGEKTTTPIQVIFDITLPFAFKEL